MGAWHHEGERKQCRPEDARGMWAYACQVVGLRCATGASCASLGDWVAALAWPTFFQNKFV
eukprot:7488055-Alexandrium_andersonii.AAC.1